MVVRIVQLLLGVGMIGGGGYLIWWQRALMNALWPVVPGKAPWLLIGGIGLVFLGLVFVLVGAMPKPKKKAEVAAETAKREKHIKEADAFYSDRAKAPDRDWRSGPIPPQPAQAKPQPVPEPKVAPPPPPQARQPAPPPQPQQAAPQPAPKPQPELVTPSPAKPAAVKPQAASAPPSGGGLFPSAATLSPMPKAAEPPAQAMPPKAAPPPSAAAQSKPTAVPSSGGSGAAFDRIRAALRDKKLDEADKILSEERERLTALGEANNKAAMAELTALAGDHAEASGRSSNAKWLWRLAHKRFVDAGALNHPAAKALTDKLRLIDQ
jgi:hypothetical protein